MWGNSQRYYRPYSSDDESDSDQSDTGTSVSSVSSDTSSHTASSLESSKSIEPTDSNLQNQIVGPNFKQFALNLQRTAGPSFSTMKEQLDYGIDKLTSKVPYSYYEASQGPPDPALLSNYGSTKFATESKQQTSIIVIDSTYRDYSVYSQPTLLTLRLPRVYKNIVNIQMVQIKLLSSFYYFTAAKNNISMTIQELGRYIKGTSNLQQFQITIKEGTYNINSLITQLTNEINKTPLFYYYNDFFSDFNTKFQTSGDYSLNFNEPGDTYYDPITGLFVDNPTKAFIVSKFWKNPTGGKTAYSILETKVAYYYPPLKWAVINEEYSFIDFSQSLNIFSNITTVPDIINYINGGILGLDDPLVVSIITHNTFPNDSTNRLENYRTSNTFTNFLINKYVVALEQETQKITISTTSLNRSLTTLINNQYNSILTNAILYYPTTPQEYANSQNTLIKVNSLIQDMYSYLQKQFLTYFGVNYNQYSINYYTNLNWTFLLQNGENAVGLASNLLSSEANNISTYTSNILSLLQQNPNHYWPRYKNSIGITSVSNTISMINLSNKQFGDINHPYITQTGQFYLSNFNLNIQAINSNTGFFYSDITNTLNCIVPIQASKYTVFKFHSPVRQSIQVETLPRPLQYRIPDYNVINYSSNIINVFDASYCFIPYSNMPYSNNTVNFPTYVTLFDNLEKNNLTQVPGWTSNNISLTSLCNYSWGTSLSNMLNIWDSNGGAIGLNIASYNRSVYFTFRTPLFSNDTPNDYSLCNFRYTLKCMIRLGFTSNVTSNYQTVVTPQLFRCFLYRDRAAFQADVLCNRVEYPINYLVSTIVDSNTTSNTFTFQTYPNQDYYMIVRPDVYSFGQVYVSVNPYFDTLPPIYDVLTTSVSNMNPNTDIFLSNFYKNNFQYSKLYDPAFIQLPIQSNIQDQTPLSDDSSQVLNIQEILIGYDTNGVSTDYTDYIPYVASIDNDPNNNLISFDPYNTIIGIDPITQYLFQKNQPYSILSNTYLYSPQPTNSNCILTPAYRLVYTPSNINARQVKICNYYSLTYIADIDNLALLNSTVYCNVVQQPYLSNITGGFIGGYKYTTDPTTSLSYLTLGRGVVGFSFIPDSGVWDLNNVVFRSAISDSTNDPNRNIKYIGVYNMNDIFGFNLNNIILSNAICILSIDNIITYTPSNTTSANLSMNGFDSKGGTYYEFKKVNSFIPNISRKIIGVRQLEATLINNPANVYSLITFDSQSNVSYIQALSGSVIPYPLYNKIDTYNLYIDSNHPPDTRYNVVFPYGSNQSNYPFVNSNWSRYGPPTDYPTGTQAQFEQSTPIGTTVIHYDDRIDFSLNSNALYPWYIDIVPNNVIFTIQNYVLFQEIDYYIYRFDTVTSARTIKSFIHSYTPSQIENVYLNNTLVAVSGNSFTYVFLGVTFADPVTYQLRFILLDNITGNLSTYEPPAPIYLPAGGTIQEFYFRDTNDFVLTYQRLDSKMSVYWSVNKFTNVYSNIFPNSTYSNIALTLDCRGGAVYWMPLDSNRSSGTSIYKISSIDSQGSLAFTPSTSTPAGGSIKYTMYNYDSTPLLTGFNKFITWWFPNKNYDTLYFITNNKPYTSNLFILVNVDYTLSNMYIRKTAFVPKTSDGNTLNILSLYYGPPVIESLSPFKTAISPSIFIISDGIPVLWGAVSTKNDDPGALGSAWQIFYPFQKIVLTKTANASIPITDLSYINYPEYPHTQLFYYRNSNSMYKDISGAWGQETNSNFTVANTTFSGYYFNSYIFNVPVIPSSNNDYQYLVVRNYTPTEQSQVLMRFYLPGKYNFGYMTLQDLIHEISLINRSNTSNFDPTFKTNIASFDSQFNIGNVWGNTNTTQYPGSTMSFTCFSSFMETYNNLNKIYKTTNILVTTINSNVNNTITNYLQKELCNILPNINTLRQNYTDSYEFNILWKSTLPQQYVNLNTQWGLGWNLGFSKIDTPFTTFLRADSFYKILDDYIFMKLNPEYKLNSLDSTNSENFSITRDTTGQIENYHAKILLASFGNYSYTSIVNPAVLNPPVPRLDQMYFQLVDITGTQLSNMDCEWSATLQIVEQTTQATYGSVLPSLS